MLLVILGVMQSGPPRARASEPIKDYWFIETLVVGAVRLPEGVEILTSNSSSQPRGSIVLKNQTQTLLFVMSLRYIDVLVMATPDPGWKARLNAAHEVASYLVAPNRPADLNIEALADLDLNLLDRNILSSDPPPTDVSIPATQSSELLLVYDGQVVEVPFTLSYSLNVNFDNGTGANLKMANIKATGNASATATQRAQAFAIQVAGNNFMLVGLVVVAALLIAGWLGWRGLSRGK
jgi:hypothetical protein